MSYYAVTKVSHKCLTKLTTNDWHLLSLYIFLREAVWLCRNWGLDSVGERTAGGSGEGLGGSGNTGNGSWTDLLGLLTRGIGEIFGSTINKENLNLHSLNLGI